MKIEFDVKLDKKSLSGFLLYHNYVRPAGIFGLLVSVAALVMLILRWDAWVMMQRGILVVLAMLFTVIQPLILVSKGKRQLQMEEFQLPFHYCFSEEGVLIRQEEQEQKFSWKDIRKVVYRKEAIYVYMSTVSAFVLPKSQCDGQFDALQKMMKEQRKK